MRSDRSPTTPHGPMTSDIGTYERVNTYGTRVSHRAYVVGGGCRTKRRCGLSGVRRLERSAELSAVLERVNDQEHQSVIAAGLPPWVGFCADDGEDSLFADWALYV